MKPIAAVACCARRVFFLGLVLSTAWGTSFVFAEPPADAKSDRAVEKIFEIQQTVTVTEIPRDAGQVRFWMSLPNDQPEQRVLDVTVVSAPGEWRIVHERGNSFLFMDVNHPKTESLSAKVAFAVRRRAASCPLDAETAGSLSEAQTRLFAAELRTDEKHMEVTPKIRAIAAEVCGAETNPVLQSNRLLNYVADHVDHYSKNPSKPKCGVGDAACCIDKGGGCCTDLHSLFIALARAQGIPARIQMGYRLQAKNEGIEADPGYRCWAEYFIGGYGWISADIVEAQKLRGEERDRWLTGLNEMRIHLNQGRHFDLLNKRNPDSVNLMTIGYAEIDGVPARVLPDGEKAPQLSRSVKYVERKGNLPARLNVPAKGV